MPNPTHTAANQARHAGHWNGRPAEARLLLWLTLGMLGWSTVAVGGVYRWGVWPLLVMAAVGVAGTFALKRRERGGARPTDPPGIAAADRRLDLALLLVVAVLAGQLVPLPYAVRAWLSPNLDAVRAATLLLPDAPSTRLLPLSLQPVDTAYAVGLVAAGAFVFWACRRLCTTGRTMTLVAGISCIGLLAVLAALATRAQGSRLVYGLLAPLDGDTQPFGPFVNRNHFATWALLAVPLAIGALASAAAAQRTESWRATAATMVEGLGSRTSAILTSAILLIVGLLVSASRSGLIALGAATTVGVWVSRARLTPRMRQLGLGIAAAVGMALVAYVSPEPLMARVRETLDVGTGGRPVIWRETVAIFRDFWATGTGLGTYRAAMLVYQQADRSLFFNQAHQQYLHLAVEGGLLVMGPALVATVLFARTCLRRLAHDWSPEVWIRIGAATGLVAVAVQGLWETGLRIPANGLLFATVAAIAVAPPKCQDANERQRVSHGNGAGPSQAPPSARVRGRHVGETKTRTSGSE